jgi:hypothetical protein
MEVVFKEAATIQRKSGSVDWFLGAVRERRGWPCWSFCSVVHVGVSVALLKWVVVPVYREVNLIARGVPLLVNQ